METCVHGAQKVAMVPMMWMVGALVQEVAKRLPVLLQKAAKGPALLREAHLQVAHLQRPDHDEPVGFFLAFVEYFYLYVCMAFYSF